MSWTCYIHMGVPDSNCKRCNPAPDTEGKPVITRQEVKANKSVGWYIDGGLVYQHVDIAKGTKRIVGTLEGTAAQPANLADGGERKELEDIMLKLFMQGWELGKKQHDTPYDYTLASREEPEEAWKRAVNLIAAHDEALKSQLLAAVDKDEKLHNRNLACTRAAIAEVYKTKEV